jgi:creatinine amidohydrolase
MRLAASALCLSLVFGTAAAQTRSVFVEDLTWEEVRDAIAAGKSSAIYYAGSTEQNGPHMALGKHNFIARHVAQRIAETLGTALVYPIMPFAPTGDAAQRAGHMRFPGSVSVSDETFAATARDVALSARAAGFRNVFLMGDHGGGQQALQRVADELDRLWAGSGVRAFYVPDLYFRSEEKTRNYLAAKGLASGEHAGVSDTSELMHIDRNGKWIRRNKLGQARPESGVDGDPRGATPALGKRFIDYKIDSAVAQMRKQLAQAK